MTLRFPPRQTLALTPTPLQPLDRVSADLGGPRLWVKRDDLTHTSLSGNKLRKLEFVLARALAEGCDTLITCGGLQSNHCRSTALLAAAQGLRCLLLLRGERPERAEGNYLLDWLSGAEIRCYPRPEYQARLPQLLAQAAEDCRARGRKPWIIPTGASDEVGIWGYIQASRELAEDYRRLGLQPDWVISATGSGGTLGGLTLGHEYFAPRTRVMGVAVCDDAQTFRAKVRQDAQAMALDQELELPTFADPVILEDYLGPGYAEAGPEVFASIRYLARREGLVLDPVYTGKAFYGLIQEIKAGRFKDCKNLVFVHTGGIFGLFPYSEQLASNSNPGLEA